MDSLQLQRAGLLEGQSVSQGPQERCQLSNMLEETNLNPLGQDPSFLPQTSMKAKVTALLPGLALRVPQG